MKNIALKKYPRKGNYETIAKGFKPYEVALIIQGKKYRLWVDSIKMAVAKDKITYLDLDHLDPDVIANLIQLVVVKSFPTGLSQLSGIHNHKFNCTGEARQTAQRKRLLEHFHALARMSISEVVENAKSKGYGSIKPKQHTQKEAEKYLQGVNVKVLDAVMGEGFSRFFKGMKPSKLSEAVNKIQQHLLQS